MKYVYYSLYQFYTKIIRVHNYYPPVINIAAVIALFETVIIFLFINIGLYMNSPDVDLPYSAIVPFLIAMVLYYINEKYYREHEDKILEEFKGKSTYIKVISHFVTIIFIVLLVWGHFFNGFYDMM